MKHFVSVFGLFLTAASVFGCMATHSKSQAGFNLSGVLCCIGICLMLYRPDLDRR